MPRADVIDLEQRRRGHTLVILHGADQLQALFSELEAHIEAMPFLREEYRLRFPNDEALVMSSQAPVVNGGALLSMAPTAKLLAWRERCRRLARDRGLRIQVDPSPTTHGANMDEQVSTRHPRRRFEGGVVAHDGHGYFQFEAPALKAREVVGEKAVQALSDAGYVCVARSVHALRMEKWRALSIIAEKHEPELLRRINADPDFLYAFVDEHRQTRRSHSHSDKSTDSKGEPS